MGSSGFSWKLADHPKLPKGKTVAVVVLDGWGEAKPDQYNCIHVAETPTMDSLKKGDPDKWRLVKAHGSAVGLPTEDDMGNSEVGHNALGAGRIFAQGAKLVDQALESGKIYDGEGFKYISECFEKGTLHLIGLLSDGGVHSRLDQLLLLLKGSGEHGAKRIRVHILTDGRDVLDGSSVGFVETLENYLAELREKGVDAQIASGGGRMYVTMDRYEAVPEILLHFFSGVSVPQLMQVIGLIHGSKLRILIDSGSTLNFVSLEFAERMGYSATVIQAFQVGVANGERLQCNKMYLEVPMEIQGYRFRTDIYPLDLRGTDVVLGMPWLQGLGQVLHDWQKLSMEFWVEGQKFVIQGEDTGGIFQESVHSVVRLADHGNAEDMVKRNKTGQPLLDKTGKIQILTSHTCQPVPIAIGGPGLAPGCRFRRDVPTGGLANVAATVMNLHGFEAPSDYEPTLFEVVSRAA